MFAGRFKPRGYADQHRTVLPSQTPVANAARAFSASGTRTPPHHAATRRREISIVDLSETDQLVALDMARVPCEEERHVRIQTFRVRDRQQAVRQYLGSRKADH